MKKGNREAFGRVLQEKLVSYAPFIILGLVLVIWPPFMTPYFRSMAIQILIYGIFALSLNLIFGYTGLFSLGHAAFFGAAAYTSAILTVRYGVESFWLVAPAGILMATLLAAIFGIIALRTSGVYFLFVTLALGELLHGVALKWRTMTGGTDGVVGIPFPDLGLPFTMSATGFYYLVLVSFIICAFLLYRLIKSPFGYGLQGIREDEYRMRHLGYNTWLYKYTAFVIAGLFAGVAGVLFAPSSSVVAPAHVSAMTSATVMLMAIIGTTRMFFGPVIGATVILFLQYYASIFTPERWPLILGAVYVLTIMFLRQGMGFYLLSLWSRVKCSYGSAKD
jgi:branched-chain amino acid transport system permease protein